MSAVPVHAAVARSQLPPIRLLEDDGTARDAAKDLLRAYVLRGDSIDQLVAGGMRSWGRDYRAHIGGSICPDDISVDQPGDWRRCRKINARQVAARSCRWRTDHDPVHGAGYWRGLVLAKGWHGRRPVSLAVDLAAGRVDAALAA